MRTLLFTLEFPPFKGGVANYYGNIAKYWPLIASENLSVSKDDERAQLRVLHNNDGALLNKWLWPKWLPAYFQLKKAVESQAIEHIIVGQILPLGTVVNRFSKKSGVPYSVMLHGMDLTLAMRAGRKKMISKKILLDAENIICGNHYTAGLLEGFMGRRIREKTHVVHPGVSQRFQVDEGMLSSIQKKYNLNNKTVVLSFGRLVKRKGFMDVVKALPSVISEYPDVHYFVSGDGPEKVNLLDASMKNKNVTYLGHMSDEEKNAWLEACDLFIMPSYSVGDDYEGFGIVFLEANIAGKPVIGGRSGGVPEAIDDGISGFLVEPRNTEEIATAIKRLVRDPRLRQKIGEQGRNRAREWFNWERQAGRFYKIVNKIN